MSRRLGAGILAVLLAALMGCAGLRRPEAKVEKSVRLPTRVAVLPFYLDVRPPVEPIQRQAAQILREQFFNRFASLSYLDLDLAEVDRRLQAADIPAKSSALALDPQRLATVLGVDGLVVGRVTDVKTFKGGIITDVRLGGILKLITKDGEVVWEGDHIESRQGGLLLRGGELLSALEDISSQFKDERLLAYLKLAEEFSRKVVATVPQPTRSVSAFAAPSILRVTVQVAPNRVLRAGDRVGVALEGDTGMKGAFDLGPWRTGLPLVEVSPGRYAGSYLVQAGDAAEDVPVSARLTDAFGLSTASSVEGLALQVDAAPPPPPENVVAQAAAASGVEVRWRAVGEAAGFALFRSCPSGGELTLLVRVADGVSYTDRSAPPSAASCTYQVSAYDSQENFSYPAVAQWR